MRAGKSSFIVALIGMLGAGCGAPTAPSIPNIEGKWAGSWHSQNCVATGIFRDFDVCSTLHDGFFDVVITQSGGSLQGGIGIQTFGSISVSGQIERDGDVALSGQSADGQLLMIISGWRASVKGATISIGTLTAQQRYVDHPDFMEVTAYTSILVPGAHDF